MHHPALRHFIAAAVMLMPLAGNARPEEDSDGRIIPSSAAPPDARQTAIMQKEMECIHHTLKETVDLPVAPETDIYGTVGGYSAENTTDISSVAKGQAASTLKDKTLVWGTLRGSVVTFGYTKMITLPANISGDTQQMVMSVTLNAKNGAVTTQDLPAYVPENTAISRGLHDRTVQVMKDLGAWYAACLKDQVIYVPKEQGTERPVNITMQLAPHFQAPTRTPVAWKASATGYVFA